MSKISIVTSFVVITSLGSLLINSAGGVHAHGDVVPQAVDTTGLEPLGEQWLGENPYRTDESQKPVATEIGASAYNQNCARCHGLEAISGGIAPDLRLLKGGIDDDEWFLERVRNGYHQNGITKMPGFETLMNQEAMWAIRTYIESRPLP